MAFLTHCYGHILNLALGDMIRVAQLLGDTMGTAGEVSKIIKKSSRRDAMLPKLKELP